MKIIQINKLYYPWIGGIEKIVQQISEGLNNKNNIEIEVLCCSHKGPEKEEIINGVKIHRASSWGMLLGMPVSFGFLKFFKKISPKFDLIDIHHPFPLANLAVFLFRPKTKIVIHYHSDIVRQKILNFLLNPLITYTLEKAEVIMVSNPNLLQSSPLLKNFRTKCKIIPFGVDLDKFSPAENERVKKIKEKYGKFILFAGRINYYKGLEYLIGAVKNTEANLVIIGDGPLKKLSETNVKNIGLADKIYFLPSQGEKELINYYRACNMLVLPSIFKSEAFGLVLIEAMACAKPVISTELHTGTSWINQDGVTGFIAPPRNAEKLAESINKIIANDNLSKKLGKNALLRAQTEFSLEKMLNLISIIYNDQSND